MGKSAFVVFPFAILIVSVLMNGGNLQGSAQNVCFNQNQTQCSQNGDSVTFSCPGAPNTSPCRVPGTDNLCSPKYPPPVYCLTTAGLPGLPSFQGFEFINPGVTMTTKVVQQSGQGVFNFGSVGVDGLVAFIGVAVAVAVLASLTIFGSGFNSEGIHIMFIAGMLLGIWFFLAALEGFLTGSSTSFFSQINSFSTTWKLPPLGTIIWIILTAIETIGVVSFISRGGTT
jgi:hypothetical protein